MDSHGKAKAVEAFEELCWQIREIDRRNVSEYPQVKLLGRDCYLWQGYVVKSSPGKWNFKTRNELKMLKYLDSYTCSKHFPELIADVTVNNRTFLLLKRFPFPDLASLFYKRRWYEIKWRVLKLSSGLINTIEEQGQAILNELSQLRIIHRDITPSNLLFDIRHHHLVLLDFGYAIREGEEIQMDSQETRDLLERVLRHNLGGNYRKWGAEFSYETDKYSFDKIVQELKQISPWTWS